MSRKQKQQVVFLTDESKICVVCNITKHKTAFRKVKRMHCGYDSYCKTCRTELAQKRREKICNTTLGHLTFALQRTKYRANARKLPFDLDVAFLLELYLAQKGLCALSREVLTTGQGEGRKDTALSIDRIDSEKGYTKDNVQLICYIVNIMKNTLTQEQLFSWCQKILNTNKTPTGD